MNPGWICARKKKKGKGFYFDPSLFISFLHDSETQQDSAGASWVQKPLGALHFLFVEKRFSLLGLPWVQGAGTSSY